MTEKTDLVEIMDTLKNAGFDVQLDNDSFLVGLNRPVNPVEVWAALDFDETVSITRQGDKVKVQ